ncbi:MAG: GspH/FimT family pseudopilin [Planctomycetota bacterium]
MRRRCAYTFIELMIVVLVMGILAGVAAPRYMQALDYYRVESAAKRIAADFRYARQKAIDDAAERKVVFDLASDSYELLSVGNLDRQANAYIVSPANEGYAVDITAADFGGQATCTFSHLGDAADAGSVTITSGGESRTITVELPRTISISP